MKLSERAHFMIDNLDLVESSGVEGARWEYFQLALMSEDTMFSCDVKARQVAWSWTAACDAIACAMLDGVTSFFVSMNLEEAKEKIRYARSIYKNLHLQGLPALTRDNEFGLEFGNGARLISLPSKAPRGKSRARIYLDEFAHCQGDNEIYVGALPVLSKGGVLRIGSSPRGASGTFWEISQQKLQSYGGYSRRSTPWWHVYSFCTDVSIALVDASTMSTADRVKRFGNQRIRAIFENMIIEDFQQEYECVFVDETTAWITWSEIRSVQSKDLVCCLSTSRGERVDEAFRVIDDLREETGIEDVLGAGVDIGRTRDATEITFVGISRDETYPLRLGITLEGTSFDVQKDVIGYALRRLSVVRMQIDQNGIGRNLAENLESEFPGKVEGVNFTNASKALWATDAKMLIQQRKTPLPIDRDLSYQIHSIKKTMTGSRNLVFDTERNEKHHADKFWAWALALSSARTTSNVRMKQGWVQGRPRQSNIRSAVRVVR